MRKIKINTMIKKDQILKYIKHNDKGFAIYLGEIYQAKSNSYIYKNVEIVELYEDGDGVPSTFYPIDLFKVIS